MAMGPTRVRVGVVPRGSTCRRCLRECQNGERVLMFAPDSSHPKAEYHYHLECWLRLSGMAIDRISDEVAK